MPKITKVNLIPVGVEDEVNYQVDRCLKVFGSGIKIIDDYCDKYEHETPWKTNMAGEAKYYLYRVQIGVIGRIKTSRDAAILGVGSKNTAHSNHFASMGLYNIFRTARLYRRELLTVKKVESWINNMLENKSPNSRRVDYEYSS
jgi:hypothetical protein